MTAERDREEGLSFQPKFGADGLAACVAIDVRRGDVLMVAHMNEAALEATLKTGVVHYWSRSRGALWRKGDTSGQIQRLVEMRVDCDRTRLSPWSRSEGTGAPATLADVPVSIAGSRPGSTARGLLLPRKAIGRRANAAGGTRELCVSANFFCAIGR